MRGILSGQKISDEKRLRAIELRRNPTLHEAILWPHLRASRLGGFHFRRQQIIAGFIVDFYCNPASVVVELDGHVHHKQTGYDQERDSVLIGLGLTVLRFTNQQIENDLESVLSTILEACSQSKNVIGDGSPFR